MQKQRIIVISLSFIIVALLSMWGVSKVKDIKFRKLQSEMTYTTDDIYQIINDSPLFRVTRSQDNTSKNCIYKSGEDYINVQMTYENDNYYICILTIGYWEDAWNLAQSWTKHAKQNEWAFNMYLLSYGDVLIQVIPVDEEFIQQLNSSILNSSKEK